MTFDQMVAWFVDAKPGATMIYHRGGQLSNIQKRHNYSDNVWAARYLYNQGYVILTQRRVGTADFEYIATRRERIEPPEPAYAKGTGEPVHLFAIPRMFLVKKAA